MRIVLALALVACTHDVAPRGDWCGTERAESRFAGELIEKCDGGDFLACERARSECAHGRQFFCMTRAPAKTASPIELRARLASACEKGNDCVELGQLLVRMGEDPEPTFQRACDQGDPAACNELGSRISARATEAENAGDWNEAARLHRLGCYKHNVPAECTALEGFRTRAQREAEECEAGQNDVCERAAGMLRAGSRGPTDEARADALGRRISH